MYSDLKLRTKRFCLEIVFLVERLPNSMGLDVIKNQLLRSATSVAANYRAVCVAQTKKIFVAKLNIVIEEADESHFWLEILQEITKNESTLAKIKTLKDEANQLVSIFITSRKTATK